MRYGKPYTAVEDKHLLQSNIPLETFNFAMIGGGWQKIIASYGDRDKIPISNFDRNHKLTRKIQQTL